MFSTDLLAHTNEELETALDAALDRAIKDGHTCPGRGILVTRHDYNSSTVQLTHEVPFCTTQELDLL